MAGGIGKILQRTRCHYFNHLKAKGEAMSPRIRGPGIYAVIPEFDRMSVSHARVVGSHEVHAVSSASQFLHDTLGKSVFHDKYGRTGFVRCRLETRHINCLVNCPLLIEQTSQ